MSPIREALPKLLPAIVLLCSICHASAQGAPEPPKPISYQDIGGLYEIHGEFGKLYTEFTIKGVVKAPHSKGDDDSMVRIDITHVRGQPLEKTRVNVAVRSTSNLAVGSEVELVVREEAKLSFPEEIDDMLSNPDGSHLGKLHCVVSLHERRLLSYKPPAK